MINLIVFSFKNCALYYYRDERRFEEYSIDKKVPRKKSDQTCQRARYRSWNTYFKGSILDEQLFTECTVNATICWERYNFILDTAMFHNKHYKSVSRCSLQYTILYIDNNMLSCWKCWMLKDCWSENGLTMLDTIIHLYKFL